MNRTSLSELLPRAIQGDTSAFRQVVETHQSFVYAVAFRIVNNKMEAEDLTQETFIRLWRNLQGYRSEIKLTTWLYTIVTNVCLDFLKSTRNRQSRLSDDLKDAGKIQSGHTPESILQQNELKHEIEKATIDLSPIQKTVFVLRDLEGLSVDEVREIMSLTSDQVKSNLYYARRKIASRLSAVYQLRNQKNL